MSISLLATSEIRRKSLSVIRRLVLSCLVALSAPVMGQNPDCVFESGPQKNHLLELFTSQGCSSCPPAEAWLSRLRTNPRLWKDFVPLAFHVDYWDQLGWRDPFASRKWTARQQKYAEGWGTGTVYTPGFVLDGRELRERSVPPAAKEAPGVLKLAVTRGSVAGEFKPNDATTDAGTLHVALLLFDQNTKVTAGENHGRELKQDFVVLTELQAELSQGKAIMPLPNDVRFGAIAGWIVGPNRLEPVQAAGGWVPQSFSDRLPP